MLASPPASTDLWWLLPAEAQESPVRELWSDRQRVVLAGQTCRTLRQSKGGRLVAAAAHSQVQGACPQLGWSAPALPQ